MTQAWKQIWQDIRGALGVPAREEAPATTETAGVPTAPVTTLLPPPDVTVEATPALETVPQSVESGPVDETDLAPAEALPVPSVWREWLAPLLILAGLAGAVWWTYFRPGPTPPAPDVVATFNGGQITVEDVEAHIKLLDPNDLGQLRTPQGYIAIINDLVIEALVRRWADEQQMDEMDDFKEAMKHITEAITVNDLHGQVHQNMPIEESEIRAYYDSNPAQYKSRPYNEVREEIRQLLVSQKEGDFMADYLARLRENASVSVEYALLNIPASTEEELQQYYQDNLAQFTQPAAAIVDEIRVRATGDEAAAEAQANEALTRLRTGEEWASVAADASIDPYLEGGIAIPVGTRPAPYDEVVATLSENKVSEVFRADDFFYIVRLKSREPEQVWPFEVVRPQVAAAVQTEAEAGWFEQMKDRTLLTINGRRMTAGEFYREYKELPPETRAQFSGANGLRRLTDQLVERLLLAEDASKKVLPTENEAEIEENRLLVLRQMLHQEEVDDKIEEVTAEEARAYYDQHQEAMVSPPQARINYIRIGLGQTEDDRQRAQAKADEAYQKVAPPGLLGGGQGLDFAEVAREYSEDPETAANGGELPGWVGENYDLMTELAEHPFHAQFLNLPEGSITPPFEYQGSLYIVQVREKRQPQPLTFEEAEPLIRDELTHQKHDVLAEQLSQKLIEQAQLVIYEETLRDLFTSQSANGS
ncbi:MAG: peptidyl-prolyl cis-trans isomerase [Anaerolineae bacterium]|nr:peptidyl-prolyl cis-trans isomerase [Anaerolineae bacterium]